MAKTPGLNQLTLKFFSKFHFQGKTRQIHFSYPGLELDRPTEKLLYLLLDLLICLFQPFPFISQNDKNTWAKPADFEIFSKFHFQGKTRQASLSFPGLELHRPTAKPFYLLPFRNSIFREAQGKSTCPPRCGVPTAARKASLPSPLESVTLKFFRNFIFRGRQGKFTFPTQLRSSVSRHAKHFLLLARLPPQESDRVKHLG